MLVLFAVAWIAPTKARPNGSNSDASKRSPRARKEWQELVEARQEGRYNHYARLLCTLWWV
jgi:hypothetical protein